jgi:hypothetical protein
MSGQQKNTFAGFPSEHQVIFTSSRLDIALTIFRKPDGIHPVVSAPSGKQKEHLKRLLPMIPKVLNQQKKTLRTSIIDLIPGNQKKKTPP